jgi:hypothetical protein
LDSIWIGISTKSSNLPPSKPSRPMTPKSLFFAKFTASTKLLEFPEAEITNKTSPDSAFLES